MATELRAKMPAIRLLERTIDTSVAIMDGICTEGCCYIGVCRKIHWAIITIYPNVKE